MKASEPANVRELATQILVTIDRGKSYADRLLDQALESNILEARDRALLTELTYGALRWRGRLDSCLKVWMRRPLEDTDPYLRNLLRLALYQLMFLDRIPPYAVLDEAVESAKNHAGTKVSGFINGILRNYLRGQRPLAQPDPERAAPADVAEYWSHPEWLVKLWLNYFGPRETAALLEANNAEPPLVLRANLRKTTREDFLSLLRAGGVKATPTPYSPQGVHMDSRRRVAQIPGFEDGLFQVQGEASQLIGYLLDPKPGERILDACAAPGGKTTHIAELMDDRGVVDAIDISAAGIARLEENARRLDLRSIRVVHGDVCQDLPGRLHPPYDRALVDAPCSGLGTLRSHPEIKWHKSESDVERLSHLQKKILGRVGGYVKAGGVLVYSTCTLTEAENERVVEDFLREHKGFVLAEAGGYLPAEAGSMVRDKFFTALPHRHNTDGFFAARIRKVA
ncbi:MAG TPA: 16S rRNA (cytosine(967)-C(5))-methyltransferase RsmB [Candidatus Binatia bacterium]|nr:16S rRNA (cytosine(967)-C(5))-methyltransferase RsmB [Candidatus Binatia bacterium]